MKYIMLVLAAILLVSCATITQPTVACNAPYKILGNSCCMDSDQNNICDEKEPKTVDQKTEPAKPTPAEDASVTYINNLAKNARALKNMHFVYLLKFYDVVGEKANVYYQQNQRDTVNVFLDRSNSKAYRLGRNCLIEEQYSKYYVPTPSEWIYKYEGKIADSMKKNAFNVGIISHTKNNMNYFATVLTYGDTILYVNDNSGLPHKVTSAGKDYIYEDLLTNQAITANMQADWISSNEKGADKGADCKATNDCKTGLVCNAKCTEPPTYFEGTDKANACV